MANLSKQRREQLLFFLNKLKKQHVDDESLIVISQIEHELTSKKFGLIWEDHDEDVDEKMKNYIPVFSEDYDREIIGNINSEETNFLLEGDNLHSLMLLKKTHMGKIKLIYIDPPYNTGSKDFIYDDAIVDKLDGYRHSKWLSFMNRRLKIAKTLLTKDGVIFISIDDNESAELKLLCDEIFGEECFVANISWQRTYSPRNDSQGLPSEVEHILVYGKQIGWTPKKLSRTEKMDSIYKSPDGDIKPWTSSSLTAPGASTHQGMVYAIQHPFTGEYMYPTAGRCWALGQDQMFENMNKWAKYKYEVIDDDEKRAEICSVTPNEIRKDVPAIVLDEELLSAKNRAENILKKGNWPYFYFTNKGKGGLRRKTYLSDTEGRMPTNFWPFSEVGHTDGAKKELKSIFGGIIPFDTPKPTSLIKRILDIASEKNDIILDFFAGSGTTAQAVFEKNSEDGGNRKIILCTNNENDICKNVTYRRIATVITGKREDGSSYSDGIPVNMKYYKTDYIDKNSVDLQEKLIRHMKEMIQLQYGVTIDNKKYVIILNDDEMDLFEQNSSQFPNLISVFISSAVLLTSSQERMLKKVNTFIIPDYYFDTELRELGELW